LFAHCVSDALIGATAVLPSVLAAHLPHHRLATWRDLGWLQFGQILEPQASGLGFTVAKLPWLNDLLGGVMALLITLTGFSMHQRPIGAAMSSRTKSSASDCSFCLRQKCRAPLTAK